MTATRKGRYEAELDLLTYLVNSPYEIADFDATTLGKLFADPDVRKAYRAIAELPASDYEAVMEAVQPHIIFAPMQSQAEAWQLKGNLSRL
jgi:hypothetical protein